LGAKLQKPANADSRELSLTVLTYRIGSNLSYCTSILDRILVDFVLIFYTFRYRSNYISFRPHANSIGYSIEAIYRKDEYKIPI